MNQTIIITWQIANHNNLLNRYYIDIRGTKGEINYYTVLLYYFLQE